MDIISLLVQYMDPYAVVIAFGFTEFIKRLLPTPPGGSKWEDVQGWTYRILPFIPLVLGMMVVMFKDAWITPTMKWDDALVKGMISGIAASYLYRTAKVTIFGGKKNGNGNVQINIVK